MMHIQRDAEGHMTLAGKVLSGGPIMDALGMVRGPEGIYSFFDVGDRRVMYSVGNYNNLDANQGMRSTSNLDHTHGVVIARRTNEVFAFQDNGLLAKADLFRRSEPVTSLLLVPVSNPVSNLSEYFLPAGKIAADLAGVLMSDSGTVYALYKDGTMSYGTVYDLDAYSRGTLLSFQTPGGYVATDIIGLAMTDDGKTLAWYDNGFFSQGYLLDLDAYYAPIPFKTHGIEIPEHTINLSSGDVDNVNALYCSKNILSQSTTVTCPAP